MVNKRNHICVCICTYKRPQLLVALLEKLQNQRTDCLFTYSVVVIDNDQEMSAKNMVMEIKKESLININYYVEARKNIALARNKAVQYSTGDFIAFIDDDEFPDDAWLLNMYRVYYRYKVQGVLGPVIAYFKEKPPDWIVKGNLCERPTYETGTLMHWSNSRTGNVLISKIILTDGEDIFDPNFGIQGEDVNFFKKMNERGYIFIWCNEAIVYEIVPPERWGKSYFFKRALLQGSVSFKCLKNSPFSWKIYIFMKTVIALFIYTFALPFLFIFGKHIFMKYLIKNFHHMGRFLAFCRITVIKEREW